MPRGNAKSRTPTVLRGWQSWVCHADRKPRSDEAREIQAIGHDITDRKRAEESGRQLAHAARFAVVGELTAMVAHEVNQPLCAILSNAEAAEILLRSENPPLEELRQILADIRQDDLRADAAIRSIRSLVHRREFQSRSHGCRRDHRPRAADSPRAMRCIAV